MTQTLDVETNQLQEDTIATTIPLTFEGTPEAKPEDVEVMIKNYLSALGDEDKADAPEDAAYYEGLRTAYECVLKMLHPHWYQP